MNNAALFAPITKFSSEVQDPETLSESIANAFRIAKTAKKGASFLSITVLITIHIIALFIYLSTKNTY